MPAKPDYYEVLGLNKEARPSAADIQKALQKILMANHPDMLKRKPGMTEEKLKEAGQLTSLANEAAKVLSNEEKRAIYDAEGHAGLERAAAASGAGAAPASTAPKVEFRQRSSEDTANFFLEMGRKSGGSRPRPRRNREAEQPVDEAVEDEVVTDFTVELSLNKDPEHGRQASISVRREVTTHSNISATETGDPVRDAFRQAAYRMHEAASALEQAALRDVVPLDAVEGLVGGLEKFTADVKAAVQQARKQQPKP